MTDYEVTGDIPVPPAPNKRGKSLKNTDSKGQMQQKTTAKIIELAKAEAAPTADPLNRDPAAAGPDPFDLESAVVNQDYLKAAETSEVEQALKIRAPNKREFFRTLPIYETFNLYEGSIAGSFEKSYYIVMPSMAVAMEDEAFRASLVLCVNKDGLAFFWPLRTEDDKGYTVWAENGWEAAKLAHTIWTRIMSRKDKGKGGDGGSGYRIKKAVGDFGQPEFPATDKAGYMRLLELAVPKATHRIASVDHPIYKFEVEGRPEA